MQLPEFSSFATQPLPAVDEWFQMSKPVARSATMSYAVLTTQIVLVGGVCGLLSWLPYLMTGEETEITQYPAPKEAFPQLPSRLPSAGEPARLWGAIVPWKADVWFFKLTGPIDDVQALDGALRKFLISVDLRTGEPAWTLPDGWQQKPGNEFRFATLVVPAGEKPLELAVSKLGRNGPWNDQLLVNVNRWYEQMSLPPLASDQLAALESVDVDGATATVVNVDGLKKPETRGRGPFMQ